MRARSCLTPVTPRTVACQAPLSMEFSRQECWSELPFPSAEDLPNPGITLESPALQADFLHLFFFNFYFYFILLYNTVLVLPYIDMNP